MRQLFLPSLRRRHALDLLLVLLSFSSLVLALSGRAVTTASNKLLVHTTSASVLGFRDNTTIPNVTILKWLGIPYAQDTSGANRWRPPQLLRPQGPKENVLVANQFGPACLQGRADGGNGTAVQSEDCLRINVLAPENAKGLPVYIYIQ